MKHPFQHALLCAALLAPGLWLPVIRLQAQAVPPAPATSPAAPPRPMGTPNITRPTPPPIRPVNATNPNAVPPVVQGGIVRPAGVLTPPGMAAPASGTAAPAPVPATPSPAPGGNNNAAARPAAPPPGAATPPPLPMTTPAPAATPAPKKGTAPNVIAFEAEELTVVLEEYYRVTGRRVLKDRGLEAVTVTISVPGEFTDAEYQDIIEKGLLMHGYALVPSGDNLYKLVAAETGSSPGQQNLPMILRSEELPKTDQVVTHVVQLQYLSAEDAANALQSAIPPHPYGKIVAVPNARSLVVTEASQTIRAYLELVKQLDLPPSQTTQKTIKLVRTDPEDVAKQLESLLDLKNSGSGSGTGSGSRPATPATPRAPAQPGIPGAPTTGGGVAQPAAASAPVVSASGGGLTAEGPKPVILPLPRTSSLLVIARPLDMELIEKLIAEIDAESATTNFISRRLNYIDLTTFLTLAEKALMRYDKNATSSTGTGLGTNTSNTSNTNNTNSGFNNFGNSGFGNSFGSFGGGFGGMGGGGFGGGLGGSSASPKLDVTTKANSVLIGRTLVIIDPGSSKFFASGPPEQLTMLDELATELDVRPRQIFISAIIGEFTLGNDFRFGLDWINTLKNLGGQNQVGGVLNTAGTAFDNANLNNLAGFVGNGGIAALGGLTAYGQIGKNLHVFMRALEQSGNFRVLQKPVLTTMNHQPASIYIGQQIAIAGQTFNGGGGLGFTSTTQYIPVRLQLDITPHIFNDKEIMLEFKQQNNSTGDVTRVNGNDVPNITEQGMTNSLIVPDRTVAMLGGLISEQERSNKTGLPFLVRLPLLKHIFGNTSKDKDRRELMIFVQPHIMADGAAHMHEQTRFMNNYPNTTEILDFAGYPEEPLPPVPAGGAPNFYQGEGRQVPQVHQDTPAEEKKGIWTKFKGLFQRSKKE
jgi:general secretion pathway protein D